MGCFMNFIVQLSNCPIEQIFDMKIYQLYAKNQTNLIILIKNNILAYWF